MFCMICYRQSDIREDCVVSPDSLTVDVSVVGIRELEDSSVDKHAGNRWGPNLRKIHHPQLWLCKAMSRGR